MWSFMINNIILIDNLIKHWPNNEKEVKKKRKEVTGESFTICFQFGRAP